MGTLSKCFAVFLTLTIAMSCLSLFVVKPANAQTIPKPSVPEFTVQYVDNSYDVPPIYETDEFTGKTGVVSGGYREENWTIQITIENQAFSYSSNGVTYHLYYNIRVKGNYGENWRDYYEVYTGSASEDGSKTADFINGYGSLQSNSQNTIFLIPASNFQLSSLEPNYPEERKFDIQVRAVVGHDSIEYVVRNYLVYSPDLYGVEAIAVDAKSDWSNTQTLTIGKNPTPTPWLAPPETPWDTQTIEPDSTTIITVGVSLNQLSLLAIGLGVAVAIAVAAVVLILRKKPSKPKTASKELPPPPPPLP
jgi:hypothetical protein